MSKKELFKDLEYLKNELGTDQLLIEIGKALNTDELAETLEFIARMWDV